MSTEREQRSSPPAHATGAVQFVAVDDIAADETFRLRPDGDVTQLATAFGRLGQLSPIELRPWPGAAGGASPGLPTTAEPAAAREAGAGAEGAAAGPQWQVVSGFRRLAAVRMLARDRVLARLHHELGDEDAWGLALGEALLHEPLTGVDLEALRQRLRAGGVAPWAEELVDEALVRAPVAAELRERFYEFLTANPIAATAPEAATPTLTPTPTPTPTPTEAERAPGDPAAGADYVEVTPEELVQDLVTRLAALNQDLATAVEAWKDLPEDGRRLVVDQARYIAALLPYVETLE